jgi:hypothetical protein
MQLISIQIIYVVHNTLASINYKSTWVSRFDMHRGLLCSKEMLESVTLHEVVLQVPLQHCPSLEEETPTTTFPTCDDDLINECKQDLM